MLLVRRRWSLPLVIPTYVGASRSSPPSARAGLLQQLLEARFGVQRLPDIYGFGGRGAGADPVHLPVRAADRARRHAAAGPGIRAGLAQPGRRPPGRTLLSASPSPCCGPAIAAGVPAGGAVHAERLRRRLAAPVRLVHAGDLPPVPGLARSLDGRGAGPGAGRPDRRPSLFAEGASRGRARYYRFARVDRRAPDRIRLGRWTAPALAVLRRDGAGGRRPARRPSCSTGSAAGWPPGRCRFDALWLPCAELRLRGRRGRGGRAARRRPRRRAGRAPPRPAQHRRSSASPTGASPSGHRRGPRAGVLRRQLRAASLYQTLALLVFAYVIRFLPEAVGCLRSGLLQVNPRLEEAAARPGPAAASGLPHHHRPAHRAGGAGRGRPGVPVRRQGAARDTPAQPDRLQDAGHRDLDGDGQRALCQAAPPALLLVLISAASLPWLLRSDRQPEAERAAV